MSNISHHAKKYYCFEEDENNIYIYNPDLLNDQNKVQVFQKYIKIYPTVLAPKKRKKKFTLL